MRRDGESARAPLSSPSAARIAAAARQASSGAAACGGPRSARGRGNAATCRPGPPRAGQRARGRGEAAPAHPAAGPYRRVGTAALAGCRAAAVQAVRVAGRASPADAREHGLIPPSRGSDPFALRRLVTAVPEAAGRMGQLQASLLSAVPWPCWLILPKRLPPLDVRRAPGRSSWGCWPAPRNPRPLSAGTAHPGRSGPRQKDVPPLRRTAAAASRCLGGLWEAEGTAGGQGGEERRSGGRSPAPASRPGACQASALVAGSAPETLCGVEEAPCPSLPTMN